jgi:CBS domain-containing protein
MAMKEFSIGGIPVVDENGTLKGIVTNRDLRFEKVNSRSILEVMTSENLVTAAQGTTLQEAEGILQENKIEKLPVVDNNNKLVGLISINVFLLISSCVVKLSPSSAIILFDLISLFYLLTFLRYSQRV